MTSGSLKVLNPQGVWGADTELNRDGFYPSLKTTLKPVTRTNYLPERDADKTPVLECIDLGITFGGLKAVDNFNIALGRTEIAGLIGPNGAGKTTIFNLLTKVYEPSCSMAGTSPPSTPRRSTAAASPVPSRTSACSTTRRCWRTC